MPRYASVVYTTLVFFILILSPTILPAQTITVDNVLITPDNASNVLAGLGAGKDGCISYDSRTRTLSLRDASLDYGIKVTKALDEVIVRVDGECSVNADKFGLYTEGYVTVIGSGKLKVSCPKPSSGAFAMNSPEAILRFKECTVDVVGVDGAFAVASLSRGHGLLVFDHVNWTSTGLVGAMNRISIKRTDIMQPQGGRVGIKTPEDGPSFSAIIGKDGNANSGLFQLKRNNKYPLRINDIDITTQNASNIFPNSVIPGSYAYYNPNINLLKICNLEYYNMNVPNIENFHDETDPPLTIEVYGVCQAWSVYASIYSRGPLIITGPGKLFVETKDLKLGASAITIDDRQSLTIKKTNVYASGYYAIGGLKENSAHLTIEDAYVEMNCTRPNDGASLIGFQSMQLHGVSILEPQGVTFDPSASGLLYNDGRLVRERVVIGNDQWNAISRPSQEKFVSNPIIKTSGHTLTIDLRDERSRTNTAFLYDSRGAEVTRVEPNTQVHLQLSPGTYIIICGDYAQKIIIS